MCNTDHIITQIDTKMKKLLLSLLLAMGCTLMAKAQFIVSAEIRPRAEFRNGFKAPRYKTDPPAFFIEQRSRLYLDYKNEKIALKLTLQDVRIWGSVDQVYKTDPNLQNVHEAWGQFNFNDRFAFRVGRMELDYDGARFLGNLDWAAQARTHDALLFLWKNNKGVRLDVGLAYNQNWRPEPGWLNQNFYDHTVTKNYKTMQFARFEKQIEGGSFVALIHNDGRQVATDSSMAYRQTYALIANKNLGAVKLSTELYYQGGKNGNGTPVNAYLAALYATFKTNLTPITFGGEILSGTNPNDTQDRSFIPLYGTNHKFYGFMDYFYVGNPHGNKGLVDLNIQTRFKLGGISSLVANAHYFMSAANIPDPNDPGRNVSRALGTEIDLVYIARLYESVDIKLGYSQMFATSSMVIIKGTGDQNAINNWAWLMITFKPTLFDSNNTTPQP